VSLDLLVSLLWYWGRSNGSDVWSLPDVVPSDFDEECMAEALPAIRRLIADDAVAAWVGWDQLEHATANWSEVRRLVALWQAAKEASS
jgi:hypothetical protein